MPKTAANIEDLRKRILTEPENALTKQQVAMLGTEGVRLVFTDDAIDAMANLAFDVNQRSQNIGARRLYTIMEKVVESVSFEAPDRANETITMDAAYIRERLADICQDEDLSRFIL